MSETSENQVTAALTLVDADTVERLLGVELGYVEWCIGVGCAFRDDPPNCTDNIRPPIPI